VPRVRRWAAGPPQDGRPRRTAVRARPRSER
jgi:hypothetical protein